MAFFGGVPAGRADLHWDHACAIGRGESPETPGQTEGCACTWPIWHLSIAIHDPRTTRPRSVAAWTASDRKAVMGALEWLLQGVGDRTRRNIEVGMVAIHWRRPATQDELAEMHVPPPLP